MKPTGRRNYKLPRKVVLVKEKDTVPEPGGWRCSSEDMARKLATFPTRRSIEMQATWRDAGHPETWGDRWYVLNCGVEPAKNRWGEICP